MKVLGRALSCKGPIVSSMSWETAAVNQCSPTGPIPVTYPGYFNLSREWIENEGYETFKKIID